MCVKSDIALVFVLGVERDWYGLHWRELRSNLLRLCLDHSDELLAVTQDESAAFTENLSVFVDRILMAIASRIPVDKLGLWENALALFSDPKPLFRALKVDIPILAGKQKLSDKSPSPRQALGRILRAYLEQSRRQILADDLDVSPNRIKTWERLDHISRKLMPKDATGTRCTEAHFQQLAEAVKIQFPNDRNLPRKVKTIMAYFYQFSDECKQKASEDFDLDRQMPLDDARELLAGIGMEALMTGLQQLSSRELEIVDTAYDLGVGVVQFRSVDDYLQTRDLNQLEFDAMLERVLEKLRSSLETTINAQTGQVGAV